ATPGQGQEPGPESQTLLRTVFSQAHNNLGVFREKEKNYGQAISSFRHALDHAPGNVEAHTNLARVFRKRRNFDNALTSARAALKLKPQYIPAIIQLSKICYALRRPGEAIEAVKKVTPWLEKHTLLNVEYGRLLEKNGQLMEARERLQKALSLEPGHVLALLSLGGVNFKLDKYSAALENYQAILKIDPENILATTNLGFIMQRMGQFGEAMKAYKAALSLDPGHQETLSLYGSLLEMTGKYAEGLTISEQVLATPKLEDRPYYNAHLTKAKCERHLGRTIEALETLKTLLGGPIGVADRSRIYYEFGQAHDSLDQTEQAFRYFNKANTLFLEEGSAFEAEKNDLHDFIRTMRESDFSSPPSSAYSLKIEGEEAPVFVVGFVVGGVQAVSGFLSEVPEFQILEDSTLIIGLRRSISKDQQYPECLKEMSADEARAWAGLYHKLKNSISPKTRDGISINTHPLNFLDLPLILKLFPDAKVIFAMIHPLDAVLNCYMKGFVPNPATLNFAGFKDISEIYAASMEVWEKYKSELSFDYIELRVENLLARPRREIKKILNFIDPENKTGARKVLDKATCAEIAGNLFELYPSGRWSRYKKHMKAASKRLAPIIKKSGY
ncbi:MAG: tetratricopeptide repeat protein, partial [Proteobacteria bacterium]|nr:tetratricopeptide repeat protein [Pseudomonadota bacterium]